MKLFLILTFLSFNSYAQFKIGWNEYSQTKNTEEKALNYLEKTILKSQWMKCTWRENKQNLKQEDVNNPNLYTKGTFASKDFREVIEVETEYEDTILDENGNLVLDADGNETFVLKTKLIPKSVVVTKHCKPKNFTVEGEDITIKMQEIEDAKTADKLERKEIKASIQTIRDYDKTCVDKDGNEIELQPAWLKRLRIQHLKDMRD